MASPWLVCRGGQEVEVMARLNRKTFRFGHPRLYSITEQTLFFRFHFPAGPVIRFLHKDGNGGAVGTAVHQRAPRTPC